MKARVYDVIGMATACYGVTHFFELRTLYFTGGTRQTVGTADFLNRACGDGKSLICYQKQNDLFRQARAAGFNRFVIGEFHRIPAGTRRHNLVTCRSIAAADFLQGQHLVAPPRP